MNRVCILKSTGKLIEMQSGGDDREDLKDMRLNTLKQNALNAGLKEADIEVKWVDDADLADLMEASKPPLTYADNRRAAYRSLPDQLDMIYWDKVNGTSDWQKHIKEVKDKYLKE